MNDRLLHDSTKGHDGFTSKFDRTVEYSRITVEAEVSNDIPAPNVFAGTHECLCSIEFMPSRHLSEDA